MSSDFARQAARQDHAVLYTRVPRLFEEFAVARLDGIFYRLFAKTSRVQLLILVGVGTHTLSDQQSFPLFEIVEECYRRKSTLITAEVPVAGWHALIADNPIVDAVLVHNARRIELAGDSM